MSWRGGLEAAADQGDPRPCAACRLPVLAAPPTPRRGDGAAPEGGGGLEGVRLVLAEARLRVLVDDVEVAACAAPRLDGVGVRQLVERIAVVRWVAADPAVEDEAVAPADGEARADGAGYELRVGRAAGGGWRCEAVPLGAAGGA